MALVSSSFPQYIMFQTLFLRNWSLFPLLPNKARGESLTMEGRCPTTMSCIWLGKQASWCVWQCGQDPLSLWFLRLTVVPFCHCEQPNFRLDSFTKITKSLNPILCTESVIRQNRQTVLLILPSSFRFFFLNKGRAGLILKQILLLLFFNVNAPVTVKDTFKDNKPLLNLTFLCLVNHFSLER